MTGSVASLAHALASHETSTQAWGDARSVLWQVLETSLKMFAKSAELDSNTTPMGVYYAWSDAVLDELRGDDIAYRVVQEVLSFSLGSWEKVAKTALAKRRSSEKSKAHGDDKGRIEARYPEYPELLKEIREAKRIWREADAAIKKTHAFRMMGGLARMGTPEKQRLRTLVDKAQRIEREVLGRAITDNVK